MPGFNLTCDTTTNGTPRLLVGDNGFFRVIEFDLPNSALRVAHSGPILNISSHGPAFYFEGEYTDDGSEPRIFERREAPYSLSTRNELILMGCNAMATMYEDDGDQIAISGCASVCPDNVTDNRYIDGVPRCYGTGCCQARISMSTNGMLPSLVSYEQIDKKRSPMPAYVLIAEAGWFDGQQNVSGKSRSVAAQDVPMILQWEVLPLPSGLPGPDAKSHPNCTREVTKQLCKSMHSTCRAGTRGYTCHCEERYQGNPYSPEDDGCRGHHGIHLTTGADIAIGVAIGAGLILSALSVVFISNKLKHRRAKRLKWKFFEQNRGRLLQQLVSQRADIAERMIIPLEELEKATNNFDKSRELGGGGHGTVYKGILSDKHVVAIKKPKKVIQKEIDEFINEVAILSQINHRNVVKLYGCCLETEVPMLVYEFTANGTLYDHLHAQGPSSLSWDNRLRIATETAGSLSYLHSTASVPIIHRDIKSGNILLDDSLTSKIADFGASRYVPIDRSGVTTMVQGTRGYLDPMYFYTGRLTEKSDVYSFGVMLVELLTRKKPFSCLSSEGEGLVADFATLYAEGNLSQILDPQVMKEEDKNVQKVAALAVECIKLRREDRPTMKQVESTLGSIQSDKQHVPDTTLDNTHGDGIAINYPSTADGSDESARRYSMEEEFMLSSRYPR
ncbi:hypothetical protein ACQ4PT_021468 [Festuca glaucescens]